MPREINLSIRAFAEFLLQGGSIDSRFSGLDRAAQGSRIHRMLQKQAGKGYKAEVSLKLEQLHEGILYRLVGRADGVITEDGGVTVDEIKTTAQPLEEIGENEHPEHWGQGCIYAHILCSQQGHPCATVQLTYYNIDTDEIRRLQREYTAAELQQMMDSLFAAYHRWALLKLGWAEKRDTSLKALTFPFGGYRTGQRDMAVASYNTFQTGGRLFACAPTGIGKTISALFPAMKALGEGIGERIFYLTAKTITRRAAEEALELLREKSAAPLDFYSVTLTAKDKICFLEERNCTPEACVYAEGYYDRLRDALYEILQDAQAFGRETIEAYAQKYRLCPYELSLDISSWCDCVVGDYNYLFDPVVHLQRFFEGAGGDYLFLIDEAHNLVDRSREMYSSQLRKSDFFALKKELPREHTKLHKALGLVNAAFVTLRKQCEEENATTLPQQDAPKELAKAVDKFISAAEGFLEKNRGSELEKDLLALYFEALFFQRIFEGYDDTYITLLHRYKSEVTAKLLCLDPAGFLDESMAKGRASVLFSATLQPLRYYRETLGGGLYAKLLELESPYDEGNLGLFVADGVSTKYADRAASLDEVCHLIAQMAAGKTGNYIAYFPSYAYLRDAYERFTELYPTTETLLQQAGMDEAAREGFLRSFELAPETTMVGFCVLGGIFAEGVDLAGERLIGTAIVGVGLPQLGPEQDALRDYYNEKNGCGFEFAYQYPGMNKVLQAAGRVIRGEEDKGVVLLIDSRFTTPRYQSLFPAHWRHYRRTGSATLPGQLESFWLNTPAI